MSAERVETTPGIESVTGHDGRPGQGSGKENLPTLNLSIELPKNLDALTNENLLHIAELSRDNLPPDMSDHVVQQVIKELHHRRGLGLYNPRNQDRRR